MPSIRHDTKSFMRTPPPFRTIDSVRYMLKLILQENSFQFNGRSNLQSHGTAMGSKVAVAFANIFMSWIETEIISKR